MQFNYLDVCGEKIAYCESPGTGHPVIFIHGNSSSALAFQRQFESPLAKKHRLLAIDLPGHGKSSNASDPEAAYTLSGYASVVVDVAEKLGMENAIFVGWSLGGHILLEAADQLTKARGFVIFGTPPAGIPPARMEAFLPSPAAPLIFKAELIEEEIESWLSTLCDHLPGSSKADMRRTDGRARAELGKSLEQCNYRDEVKAVADLPIPIAILHEEKENIVNLEYINKLTMPTLWRGKVQVITDAGHLPHWEQPEMFNALLEEFITETAGE